MVLGVGPGHTAGQTRPRWRSLAYLPHIPASATPSRDDAHAGCKVRDWTSDPHAGLGRARLKRKAPQEAATANSMHASDRLIHSICGYLPWSPDDFRFVTGRCRYRPIAWQQLPTAAVRGIAHLALATCSGCTPLHKTEARSRWPVSEREHRSHLTHAKPMQPAS